MWFWWFMFICDLLVPVTMIVSGKIMGKHPPKDINGLIGYRTTRSMKNLDTWNFAHHYCGRLWWKIGWIMLVPSFLIHLPFYNKSESIIGILGAVICTLQCIIMIISIYPTERALKRYFTDEGIRKI